MTRLAPQLLTIPQTAQRLGLGRTAVYQLIATGELRSVDLGHGRSKTRIREDDLLDFVEKRTRAA